MNQPNEAGGTPDTIPKPMSEVTEDTVVSKPKKQQQQTSKRPWKEGGMKLENVKIKMLYNSTTKLVTLQFEDEDGPVFRASFMIPQLRDLIDGIYDSLLQIELDEDRAGEKMKTEGPPK